jgi:hypothetical protein
MSNMPVGSQVPVEHVCDTTPTPLGDLAECCPDCFIPELPMTARLGCRGDAK